MATLLQVHAVLQQMHRETGKRVVDIDTISQALQKTPESVQQQLELLKDLEFARISNNGTVSLTETGLLANLHELQFEQQNIAM